jgi:hypothetical protein
MNVLAPIAGTRRGRGIPTFTIPVLDPTVQLVLAAASSVRARLRSLRAPATFWVFVIAAGGITALTLPVPYGSGRPPAPGVH